MKILLLGPDGQVGWELRRSLAPLGTVLVAGRQHAEFPGDLERADSLRATIRTFGPDVIVNAAAYTAVDAAESDVDRARLINGQAPGLLADESAALGALLVHYSTDYVFDGTGTRPWREEDPVAPINAYGRTKLEGEESIRRSGCRHMIFRTSWVYAARGKNFLRTMVRLAQEREQLSVVDDQVGAPTGAELIADVTAHAILAAMGNRAAGGTWHLCAGGSTSWHGYASHVIDVARRLGVPIRVDSASIIPCRTEDFPTPARRPHNSRLSTDKLRRDFGLELPDWRDGVDRTLMEICKS